MRQLSHVQLRLEGFRFKNTQRYQIAADCSDAGTPLAPWKADCPHSTVKAATSVVQSYYGEPDPDHTRHGLISRPCKQVTATVVRSSRRVHRWAVGILLFEMLAGFPPFYDDNPFLIYQRVLAGRMNFPFHVDRDAKVSGVRHL